MTTDPVHSGIPRPVSLLDDGAEVRGLERQRAQVEPARPRIFAGARTEPISVKAISTAQRTFNEEAIYGALRRSARAWSGRKRRRASVLDLCSGDGRTSWEIAKVIPTHSITLVDIDGVALHAGLRLIQHERLSAYRGDATTFHSEEKYDLVLMNSAYHHIEDARKVAFLRNALKHLNFGGRVLLGDHFLPNYRGQSEFQAAVVSFYEPLVDELLRRSTDVAAVEIIRQAAYQCWRGISEFKVSWEVFGSHIAASGLIIREVRLVWSPSGVPQEGGLVGSAVVVLERE